MIATLVDGLSQGLLLFLMSAGLTLIFGLMGLLNLAHAGFYMLGAYLAHSITLAAGFWWALVLAPLLVGVLAAAIERCALRPLRGLRDDHSAELLFTFGLSLLIEQAVQLLWGRSSLMTPLPQVLQGVLSWGEFRVSRLRLLALGGSLGMMLLLVLGLRRSRSGLALQAALEHPHTAQSLGHDVPLLSTCVFGTGAALAAVAGVFGGQLHVTEPAMAASFGNLAFIVVIVGGMGSMRGAFAASLGIGLLQAMAASSDGSALQLLERWGLRPTPGTGWHELASLSWAQASGLLPYLLLGPAILLRNRQRVGGHSASPSAQSAESAESAPSRAGAGA